MFLNSLTSKSNKSTSTYLTQGLRQMPSPLSNISRLIPPTRTPAASVSVCSDLSDSWSELCTLCLSLLNHEQGGSNGPPTTTSNDLPEAPPTVSLPPKTWQAHVPAWGVLFFWILDSISHLLKDFVPIVIYLPSHSIRFTFFTLTCYKKYLNGFSLTHVTSTHKCTSWSLSLANIHPACYLHFFP